MAFRFEEDKGYFFLICAGLGKGEGDHSARRADLGHLKLLPTARGAANHLPARLKAARDDNRKPEEN
jgi:hypothetical protein